MFEKWKVQGVVVAVLLIFTLGLTGCLGGGKTVAFRVQGVRDQGTYGRFVTPIVTPAEGNTLKQLTLNDKAYENGTPIVASGNYKLGIVVEDEKGEVVVDEISFTLDIQTFRISENFHGFARSFSALTYNSDEDFTLRNGSPGSIKVTPQENEWNENPRVIVRTIHDDWKSDWTIYDTISVWVYFSELESLAENGVRIGVYASTTETYYGPANGIDFKKKDLVVGWNNLLVSLDELLVFKSFWDSEEHSVSIGDIIDRRGELENFSTDLFVYVVGSEPFYVSDIQLLEK